MTPSRPFSGGFALFHMMLGEVTPGGTGSGLYGMLVLAVLAVFVAGLMVGRTPEYLGKKITAREMKLVSLYILTTPALALVGTAIAMGLSSARSSIFNPGPHGFSEVLYAFTSAANNNGSAFGGLSGNTPFYNTALGLCMLLGPVRPDGPGPGPRRLPGPAATRAGDLRHLADPPRCCSSRCWSASC